MLQKLVNHNIIYKTRSNLMLLLAGYLRAFFSWTCLETLLNPVGISVDDSVLVLVI